MFILALIAACSSPSTALPVDAAALPPVGMVVSPLVAGADATATVFGAPPGTEVAVVATASTGAGRSCPPAIAPTCLDIPNPVVLLGRELADPAGNAIAFSVPDALAGRPLRLQGVIRGPRRAVVTAVESQVVLWPDADEDADRLSNVEELRWRTSPFDPDTDGGGTWDGVEVTTGTDPRDPTDDGTGACWTDDACGPGAWCDPDACLPPPGCEPGDICPAVCYGQCRPVDWCYSDEGCAEGEHCSVSDGVCDPDPSCPMCDVCTGTCVPDAPDPLPCASSSTCPDGTYCTTEDGVCDSPPGCLPGEPCPDVCYGTCAPVEPEAWCYGDQDCPGQVCSVSLGDCNPDPSCPACAVCTGVCVDPVACASSSQCPAGVTCSTEQGDCFRPPGCGPNDPCPDVCYGWCGTGATR